MAPGSEKDKARAVFRDKLAQKKGKATATDVAATTTPATSPAPSPTPVEITKADVISALRASEGLDQLHAAADLIRQLPEEDREEATAEYHALLGTGADDA